MKKKLIALVMALVLAVATLIVPVNAFAADALEAGTYQITANIYLDGTLNTVMEGTTVYMTNPSNPTGVGGNQGIPLTPMEDNATLVVGEDGSMTVVVETTNPVFTLQKIESGETVTVLGTERDSETYGSYTGRITKVYCGISDQSGDYAFGDCVEYPTLLDTDWTTPLNLSVDFDSAVKTSDETTISIPGVAEAPEAAEEALKEDKAEETTKKTESTTKKAATASKTEAKTSEKKTVSVERLKAGKYTVSANLYFKKADTGLPMNPYLTNSAFPPKDPVSNNATLTVSENGNATVTIPVTCSIMDLKSISGLNVTSTQKDSSGNITSVTVNLGTLNNPGSTITRQGTASVVLSEQAQSISGYSAKQTWPVYLEVSLSGVSTGSVTVDADAVNVDTNDSTNIMATVAIAMISFFGVVFVHTLRRKDAEEA